MYTVSTSDTKAIIISVFYPGHGLAYYLLKDDLRLISSVAMNKYRLAKPNMFHNLAVAAFDLCRAE